VTLLAINLRDTPDTISVPGPADVYALTAPQLQSREVHLNGQALVLGHDDALPEIAPQRVAGEAITLAASSISFITLVKSDSKTCQ